MKWRNIPSFSLLFWLTAEHKQIQYNTTTSTCRGSSGLYACGLIVGEIAALHILK